MEGRNTHQIRVSLVKTQVDHRNAISQPFSYYSRHPLTFLRLSIHSDLIHFDNQGTTPSVHPRTNRNQSVLDSSPSTSLLLMVYKQMMPCKNLYIECLPLPFYPSLV